MTTTFDVLVIGAGPAGLTAARVIAEGGASCAIVDKMGPGGQLMNMGEMHEYPDAAQGTTGPDLIETLVDPLLASGAELLIDDVQSAEHAGQWSVTMLDQTISAKALVIATGLTNGTTGLSQESEFEGHGISHCAVCDGPLYAGKPVVVAGSDRWAVQEAIDLSAIAGHVTLIADGGMPAATPEQQQRLGAAANLSVRAGRISAFGGVNGLDQVTVNTPEGTERLQASGLFLFTNRKGATAFLPNPSAIGSEGLINSNAGGQTGLASLFACGDVRMGAMQTVASAIADGQRTGQYVLRWLQESASE